MNSVRSQRGNRETSPDRAKICRLKHKVKPSRKVQVVYYLSRNGLLEHPHFMELTLLPNQPLRLKGTSIYQHKKGKLPPSPFFFLYHSSFSYMVSFSEDVFDRLMALRGTGMPLQYSWSSKR